MRNERKKFYDPSIGRFLEPEPMLQDPRYVAAVAHAGYSVPAYGYALNNPLAWKDPNGLDVFNDTDHVIWVKPEDSKDPMAVLPGGAYIGPRR